MESNNYTERWHSIAAIWIGAIISIPAVLTGSILANGLTFSQVLIASAIGLSIVAFYMSLQAMQSVDTRKSTTEMAGSAFGEKGAQILISLVVGVPIIGWFGIQTGIAGAAFHEITGVGIKLSSVIWGIIMLATAVYGIKFLKWLNYIGTPAIIILIVVGLGKAFGDETFTLVYSFTPEVSIGLVKGISIAIGAIAIGGVIAPDYARFSLNRKTAVISSLIGIIPVGVMMMAVGAYFTISQGTADLTRIFSNMGSPLFGSVTLIIATWTTNAVNAYSGGLAISKLSKSGGRAVPTFIAGILGIALALMGILDHFQNYLLILTSTIPPIAGVMIADYWIIKSPESNQKLNWIGILSWFIGVLFALLGSTGFELMGSIIVAGIAYVLIAKILVLLDFSKGIN